MTVDALRGHLDSLILAVVEETPRHGYAIIEALQVRSGGDLDLPTGTVYPALRRLEAAGHLKSTWATIGGRKRRTYTLSASGRRALAKQRAEWRRFSAVVDGILGKA
jgi:PadR family transcriptional regulator PadR